MKRTTLYGLLAVLAFCGAAAAQSTTAPSADSSDKEKKLVDEMFGKKIAAAKASPSKAAALDVAEQMIEAASDTGHSDKLRVVLASQALQLALPIGTEAGFDDARKALDICEKGTGLADLEKATLAKEFHVKNLAWARTQRKGNDFLFAYCMSAVEAYVRYVKAAVNEEQCATEITNCIREAKTLVAANRLDDQKPIVEDVEKYFQAMCQKRQKLKDALAKLDEATRAKKNDAIKAANKLVGAIYLESDGDLRMADKYLNGTDEPRAAVVAATVAFLEHPEGLDMKKALDQLDAFAKMTEKLPDVARIHVAGTGVQIAQAIIAAKLGDLEVSKAKMIMAQLETYKSGVPSTGIEKLKKDLIAGYGTFQGKLEMLEKGQVRVTYDFSNPNQLKDWDANLGDWTAPKGSLLGKSEPYNDAYIRTKLMFRTDKPFKVTFTGKGQWVVGGGLSIQPWKYSFYLNYWYSRFLLTDEGIKGYGFSYEDRFYDTKTKLQGNKSYKMEFVSEGKGTVTWLIDGAKVKAFAPVETREWAGAFRLRLHTAGSANQPTVFNTVVIEGEVLPDPQWMPQGIAKDKTLDSDDSPEKTTKTTSKPGVST